MFWGKDSKEKEMEFFTYWFLQKYDKKISFCFPWFFLLFLAPHLFRESCWKVEERGAVGERAFHVCFLMQTPTHLLGNGIFDRSIPSKIWLKRSFCFSWFFLSFFSATFISRMLLEGWRTRSCGWKCLSCLFLDANANSFSIRTENAFTLSKTYQWYLHVRGILW